MNSKNPIGVFDSGFGGLTVLKAITKQLPQYDYLYLGDNARAPYGPLSFETVYQYTLQSVSKLFEMGCPLVILACNTASAKALRNIQQKDLARIAANKRVLGVIRPTTEIVGKYSKSGHIGVLGTTGTIVSESYPIEIAKFYPELIVNQEACPTWVPIVENNEIETEAADASIKQHLNNLLSKDKQIDTIILGCTHYPLLLNKIKSHLPAGITLLSQGDIIANSLMDYLKRHTEIETQCSKGNSIDFYTTDSVKKFNAAGSMFFGQAVNSKHLDV